MTADVNDLLWQTFEGRDKDGDRFIHHVLLHGSGRILAKVYQPCQYDAYNYEVAFFLGGKQGEDLDKGPGQARFIDLESAKVFIEDELEKAQVLDVERGMAEVEVREKVKK